ncbi:MAG TPA: TIGR03620 family F420-dependent LLM class oxidoreductase [Candidatus Limnocylindrales bacterium]|jgi:probable F420-dependent oxidoreductase
MATISGIGGIGGRVLAGRLGRVGVWSFALQRLSAVAETEAMAEFERLGYPAVWIPESLGSKEVFAHAGILLNGSKRAIVAPGIASIYARDPMAMANGARAIAEAHPGRFVLGIGVSHAPSVAMRGGSYGKPLEAMIEYLDGMTAATYAGPDQAEPVPLVLAALGPRMLELAAARADGAHPYFVPIEHTPIARKALGPEPCLAVEMTAVLSTNADAARRVGRAFARHYLALPNYANNLRRLGWSDEDIANDGSDRLIDAVIAWGDVDAIARRVRAHLDRGADHVCVQLRADSSADPALAGYAELAAALLEA